MVLTASNLVDAISSLGTQKAYDYYTGRSKIRVIEITRPEGPITFLRWDSDKPTAIGKPGSVSINQLATAADVFSRKPNYPIHFDRLFSAGGNTRTAFETLLVYTPHFFLCYPQRTHPYTGNTEAKQKHIMWCPDREHPLGEIGITDTEQVISEFELGVEFGEIKVTSSMLDQEFDTIEAKRTHAQMQVAMVEIGNALGFRTWIARNDHAIGVGDKQLGTLPGVIRSLDDVPILYTVESRRAASLIDCIWFSSDYRYMPAVIEVEHSTGVTSGLTRMLKLKETIPSITTKFTIVASSKLRHKVVSEANNPAFRQLEVRFMPYATVRELYGLIKRYSLSRVVERNFIEPFMESVVEG